jgi:hypothetical protein
MESSLPKDIKKEWTRKQTKKQKIEILKTIVNLFP